MERQNRVLESANGELQPRVCRFAKASRKKVRKKLDAQIHLVGYRRTKRLQTTPQVCPSVRLQCLNRSRRFPRQPTQSTPAYRGSTGWPYSTEAVAFIV